MKIEIKVNLWFSNNCAKPWNGLCWKQKQETQSGTDGWTLLNGLDHIYSDVRFLKGGSYAALMTHLGKNEKSVQRERLYKNAFFENKIEITWLWSSFSLTTKILWLPVLSFISLSKIHVWVCCRNKWCHENNLSLCFTIFSNTIKCRSKLW